MKSTEIISKIAKLPVPTINHSDVQVVLRLITVLAATHLVNKVNKTITRINDLDNPDNLFKFFK